MKKKSQFEKEIYIMLFTILIYKLKHKKMNEQEFKINHQKKNNNNTFSKTYIKLKKVCNQISLFENKGVLLLILNILKFVFIFSLIFSFLFLCLMFYLKTDVSTTMEVIKKNDDTSLFILIILIIITVIKEF